MILAGPSWAKRAKTERTFIRCFSLDYLALGAFLVEFAKVDTASSNLLSRSNDSKGLGSSLRPPILLAAYGLHAKVAVRPSTDCRSARSADKV